MDTHRASRRALALLVIVFVLGVALGAMGTYLVGGRGGRTRAAGTEYYDRRARMLGRMTQELALTPDQQKQIDGILADMGEKYQAIHEQIAPQTAQVRQRGREQILALLTPEQKLKYEEFLRRLDEERKKKKNGR